MVASHHDRSFIPKERLHNGRLEVSYFVEMRGGGRRDVPIRNLPMSSELGVWEFEIDLKKDLNLEGQRALDELTSICNKN